MRPITRSRWPLGMVLLLALLTPASTLAQTPRPLPSQTTVRAAGGDIVVTPIMHASTQIEFGGRVIQIDPAMGDITRAKAADLILVTDIHEDHFSADWIQKLRKPDAPVVVPEAVKAQAGDTLRAPVELLANGESRTIAEFAIEAVPMYNIEHKMGDVPFHTKGRGNGYVITIGGKRIYFAGDTECVPEIKALQRIDVAFLPMNLPFTMSAADAAGCAKAFNPSVVVPYHFAGERVADFETAMVGSPIEVRRLNWYPAFERPEVIAIARPGTLVDLGGRRLHLNCSGSGQPTVLLDAGGQSFAIDWTLVQRDVARRQRVCSYDRAGYGWSDPSGQPDTTERAADDLLSALARAGERGPFVFVAASDGVETARIAARRQPAAVVGFVLIDGAHEDGAMLFVDGKPTPVWSLTPERFQSELQTMRPADGAQPPPPPPPAEGAPYDRLPADVLKTRVTFELRLRRADAAMSAADTERRFTAMHATLRSLHDDSTRATSLGDKPLISIRGGMDPNAAMKTAQAKLLTLTTNAIERVDATSGPEVYLFDPAVVVQAIGDVVESARTNARLVVR